MKGVGTGMNKRTHERFLFVIPAIMLFGALLDSWPYGYFQILRWVTCASAVFYMFRSHEKNQSIAAYAFAGIAILFNPLLPIRLSRDIWAIADGLTATFFIGYGVLFNLTVSKENAARAEHEQTKYDLLSQRSEKIEQEYKLLKKEYDRSQEQNNEEIALLRKQIKEPKRHREE